MSDGSAARPCGSARVRARVEGTVQGVGFRPFVYRLASELGLAGLGAERRARRAARGRGRPGGGRRAARRASPPRRRRWPRSSGSRPRSLPPTGEPRASRSSRASAPAPPPPWSRPTPRRARTAWRELFDPADRRYRYPFINCTNCGPRFTIVRDVPYDRPQTTMAGFAMCAACRAEYDDPADRRFHAQPNACPDCGPRLRLVDAAGRRAAGRPAARGGDRPAGRPDRRDQGRRRLPPRVPAADEEAVATLRARKHREDKPFALMAPDLGRGACARRRCAPPTRRCSPGASGRSCSRPAAPGPRSPARSPRARPTSA